MTAGLARLRQIRTQKPYEEDQPAWESEKREEGILPEREAKGTGSPPLPPVCAFSGEISQEQQKEPEMVTPSPEPVPFHDDGRETAPAADAWLCPHCGRQAVIEDVFPSQDGERRLTMWSCDPCGVVAVTPDAIKEPPTGWVSKTRQ